MGVRVVFPDMGKDPSIQLIEKTITENGTYETKGEMYNKVTVNVEGGGGESDFSTAKVTFNVSVASAGAVFAFISSEYNDIEINNVSLGVGESTYTIPLYKNGQYMRVSYKDGTTPVITGDVTYEGNEFAVTGDCTISVEGEPLT